jgi:membrane protein YdbS with pleckstrin-like domain
MLAAVLVAMPGSLPDVSSTGEPEGQVETRKSPLPLPARFAGVWPFIIAGTVVWFLLFCALAVARYVAHADPGVWLWTALAGWVLGIIGMLIMRWQRGPAR